MINHELLRTPQGVYKTRSLFFELALERTSVVYTLKSQDHEGYPSLNRLYLEMEDPTEYQFAKTYLANWDHWLKLSESDFFIPYLEQWRTELELKLKSKAYHSIAKIANSETKDSFSANKYLLESYRRLTQTENDKPSKGRPSKSDIDSAAFKIASSKFDIEEDSKRIRLVK